jgi:hypothetical protein
MAWVGSIRFLDRHHHIDVGILVILVRDCQERIRLDACTTLLDTTEGL